MSKVPHIAHEVVVTDESPADAVLSCVRQQDVDLIALTTSARHGLSRWGRSSIMDAVMHRSSAPVLVLRGEDAGGGSERTASSATAV